MRGDRWPAVVLAAALLAQSLAGADYIARTTILDGDERVFVLWDDAMISMRYARNLASGHGLVWNPGEEAVQGYTNLGLTLLMAGAHALPVAREQVALVIQLLALAALATTLALTARLVTDLSRSRWAGVGAAAALLFCAPYQIFALQGSDTGFVGLLVVAGYGQLIRGWVRQHRWPTGAFAPLLMAVLLRPDATLFALAAGLVACLFPGAQPRRDLARPLIGLAVLWAGLVGFSLAYYGDPLPNTYYLKATGASPPEMWASGVAQLSLLLPGGLLAAALAGAAFLAPTRVGLAPEDPDRQDRAAVGLLAAGFGGAAAYHVWVGGDWIQDYGSRHLVQAFPLLLALAGVGAARVGERIATGHAAIAATATLALSSAAGLGLTPAAPAQEWFRRETPTLFHSENQMNWMRARFLARATRPDTRVAVHWAGVGPYFADRPSLDVLGRSDRHIAHSPAHTFEPGHSKWDWDYVLEQQRPDLIDFESRGLRDHPTFRRDYLVLSVGPRATLFLRRDATGQLTDRSLETLPLEALLGPPRNGAH